MNEIIDGDGARKEGGVFEATWGHLRARVNVRYRGTIIFAEGQYGGERVILRAKFEENADCGPWFYRHIHDWLCEQATEPGTLYTFTGWYQTAGDDSYEFQGGITTAELNAR